jgi:hypothetical protein
VSFLRNSQPSFFLVQVVAWQGFARNRPYCTVCCLDIHEVLTYGVLRTPTYYLVGVPYSIPDRPSLIRVSYLYGIQRRLL